jgi:hypothetical protein
MKVVIAFLHEGLGFYHNATTTVNGNFSGINGRIAMPIPLLYFGAFTPCKNC